MNRKKYFLLSATVLLLAGCGGGGGSSGNGNGEATPPVTETAPPNECRTWHATRTWNRSPSELRTRSRNDSPASSGRHSTSFATHCHGTTRSRG